MVRRGAPWCAVVRRGAGGVTVMYDAICQGAQSRARTVYVPNNESFDISVRYVIHFVVKYENFFEALRIG